MRTAAVPLFLLLWLSDAAPAASVTTPLPPSSVEEAAASFSAAGLHALLREHTGPDGYTGGVTLVARDGRLLDWQAYGFRDLARREPMQRDDIFRLYSMTKPIASVAVLMLVEEGKVALDAPVASYLPELANLQVLDDGELRAPRRPVTVRHLLTHTAGFAAGLPGDELALQLLEEVEPSGADSLAAVVRRLATVPLASDPGRRFGYEAAPLEILARVVEVQSGQAFDAFLRERIFAPLRMRETWFEVPRSERGRVVDLTAMGEDGRLRIHDSPSARTPGAPLRAFPSAAGGLYSTAADYARFCQMLVDGGTLDGATLLRRETVDEMFRNQLGMLARPVTQYSDGEGFGFGGYVVTDPAVRGAGRPGQWGWSGAASTSFWIDRERRAFGILLLQHLPNGAANDLPRIARPVQERVNQDLR